MTDAPLPQDIQARLKEAEAQEWFSHMVPGLAHDLSTLLGICITATSHLQDQMARLKVDFEKGTLGKTAFRTYLQHLQEASELLGSNLDRAKSLAGSLKHLAVSQAREEPEMVDLGTLLNEIALAFSPQMKKQSHRLEVRSPDVLLVRTLPADLTRVLMNLVQNALIHAFSEGREGHLLIQAEAVETGALIKVADDGAGMEAGTLARIFEPYFTTRRGAGGTGLGLSLCKELVEGPLGGGLTVESVPGYGTSFLITLPNLRPEGGSHV